MRQLRYFRVLSGALQYREAARRLGISQPSLSQQIAALEDAVGTRLVERRRNGLILTPAGREVALRAVEITEQADALKHVGKPADGTLSGNLRLGASPTIGPYLLPRVLRRLHEDYPDFGLVIRDGTPQDLLEDLIAGRHDLILAQLPLPEEAVRVLPLFREPLQLVVARDHRLAGRDHVRAADLAGEQMLSLSPSYALHRQTTSLAAGAGAALRQDFEGTSLDALRQMVALGMGVTILPNLYIRSEISQVDADVVAVPLRPVALRDIGLAWRVGSGYPPAFTRLGELVRQLVASEFAGSVAAV